MESIDFTGLAARAVAGLHEVRACLLASRDGLTLAALPEGGEDLARRALDRLETVGRPERGFLVIGDEVWVVSRRGPYLGIVVAAATARAGLLLDRLESTLRAAEEARLHAGSAGPGRPEIPRRPRTPLHRDRSEMKPPNPLFEEVARVVSVPEETHRSESSVGEASATTAWPRTIRQPESPTGGGPGSGSEPPTIVRPTPQEPEEPKVVAPEPEPEEPEAVVPESEPEEPEAIAPEPEPEEPEVVAPEPEPEEPPEQPTMTAPEPEEEQELTTSAEAPRPDIAARETAESEVDTAEPGPIQGLLRRYVRFRSDEPSASAVTPTEERQAIEPEITAARPEAEEPVPSTFEPQAEEPTTEQREPHVLDRAAVVSETEKVAQPDEPEKDDDSVHETQPASMSVDSPIPERRVPTFQEQLEALEISPPSPGTIPEPPVVDHPVEASESDTKASQDRPAPLPRLAQPHVDIPKATPHYSPPDALLGEMGRVVAGESSPADILPPGVSPAETTGLPSDQTEKEAAERAGAKTPESSKERGEDTEVDPVALAREFSQLFDEPERNS